MEKHNTHLKNTNQIFVLDKQSFSLNVGVSKVSVAYLNFPLNYHEIDAQAKNWWPSNIFLLVVNKLRRKRTIRGLLEFCAIKVSAGCLKFPINFHGIYA